MWAHCFSSQVSNPSLSHSADQRVQRKGASVLMAWLTTPKNPSTCHMPGPLAATQRWELERRRGCLSFLWLL